MARAKKPLLQVHELRWSKVGTLPHGRQARHYRNAKVACWVLRCAARGVSGPERWKDLTEYRDGFLPYRKWWALRRAVEYCRRVATAEHPISLRIYRKDGRIQEERTYPRSADSKKSKG